MKLYRVKRWYVAVIALLLSSSYSYSQLTLDATLTPEEIAQNLVGLGVEINNVSVNAADSAYAYYYASGTEIGTSEGIILSTGNIINAIGPNNSSGLPQIVGGVCQNCDFFDNEWPGSDLLDAAQDRTTFDAASFEFDVIPQGDSLKFSYTFASEEYLEWVDSPFNDVFGFYISGPGIGIDVPIAIVPGTPSTPVAINTINPGSFPEFYGSNLNPNGEYIQYDGFTVGLEAVVGNLIPCQTYHLELVIADGTDRLYDSAVFVEKIESNPVTVLTATAGGTDAMIEGCNDGTISFVRPIITDEAQVVTFWIGGTATDGVDYTPQIGTGTPGDPLTIVIPANESTATIDLTTIADGIDEGTEYLTIYLANPLCNNGIQDSVNFFLEDFLLASIEPSEATICFGDCITLTADVETGGTSTFEWSPLDGLSNSDTTTPEACPEVNTTYTITSQVSECIATATSEISVTQIELILETDPVNCADVNFGSIDLTVNNATGPLTIEWTGPDGYSSNDEDPSGLVTGTYCVTVTDANGCIGTDCIEVIEFDVLEVDEVSLSDYVCFPISCAGECDGSITLTVIGGVGPYDIQWDDDANQTGPIASDLCAGTYTATISDQAGCVVTETITLEEPDPLDIELIGTVDVLCNGEETGVATVTSTGGCTPYFYSWSHDPSLETPVANNLPSGTFTVTVSDVNGCQSDDEVTLTIGEPGEPITVETTVSTYPGGFNVSCPDATDGQIDITISGGTPGYAIQWFDGGLFLGAGTTLADLGCGTYTLQVSDDNDCVYTEDIEILCPPAIDIDFVSTPNPCLDPMAGLGTIDVSVSGGFPDYTYDWTGPDGFTSVDEDLTGLNSGTYTVTVTDTQGCTQTQDIIVATSDEIVISSTVADASCFGNCDGSIDISISGGLPDFIYEWTFNGEFLSSDEDIPAGCAGEYEVIVTDAGGCQQVAQFEILQPAEIVIDIVSITQPACEGQNDGAIDIEVSGGVGILDVEWAPNPGVFFPGSMNEDISNLFEGVYSVTVTDETGCSVTQDIVLDAPQVMDIFVEVTNFDGGFNVSCNGAGDGQISVSVNGGTPDCVLFDPYCYEYDWGTSPIGTNDPASPTLTELDGGTYLVIVTDANGCVATTEIPLLEPEELQANPVLSDYNGFNISCPGESDGSITPNISGGNGEYVDFDWSGGDDIGANAPDAATLTDLPAGTYVLEVTDSNGCTSEDTFVLDEPTEMDITIDGITPVTCYDYNDGAISVSATGGAGGYTYSWTGPSCDPCMGNVISMLEAGTYEVTVTDANGCTYSETVTLDEPPLFDVNLTVITLDSAIFTLPCLGDETAAINATIEGGVPDFDIEWTLDGGFFSDELSISELGAGEYCLTVTDGSGCISTECYDVTEPDEPLIVTADVLEYANGFNISCFGECDGAIDLTVTGGVPGYTFVWRDEDDNEISFDEDLVDVCAGEYEVVIEDANGCIQTLGFELSEPEEILVDLTISEYNDGVNVSCADAADGTISASASGGAGEPYTYSWTGEIIADGPDLTDLNGGTYILTVTDAEGCSTEAIVNLIEPDPISFDPILSQPLCNGGNDGAIDANITGGSGVYDITWDEVGDETESISGLEAGSYTINVTDSNGCTGTETFVLNEPTQLDLSATTVDATCGEENGSIDLTIEGGTEPYSIEWTGPTNIPLDDEDPDAVLAGDYTAIVTDDNGCEAILEITVGGPEAIVLALESSDILCFGDANGFIDLTITNGEEPFNILWTLEGEDFSIDEDISDLDGGSYEVVVTDANGCSISSSATISEPAELVLDYTLSVYPPNDYNVSTLNGTDGSIDTEINGGTPEYNLEWEGPSNIEDGTSDPEELMAGDYALTITDANGCVLDTVITLTGPQELRLPTGFTPNGDGYNDTYIIMGLDQYPDNVFKVFNRWGNLVYEKKDYDNLWDGKNNDGEELPDGTYFVIFEASDKSLNTYVDLRR